MYLTLDKKKEAHKRLSLLEGMEENYQNLLDDIEEISMTDGLRSCTSDKIHGIVHGDPKINLILAKEQLTLKKLSHLIAINDTKRGFNLLNEREKEIMKMRYIDNKSVKQIMKEKGYEKTNVYQIIDRALSIMAGQITDL